MTFFLVNGAEPSLVSRSLSELLEELAGPGLFGVETYEPAEDAGDGEVKGRIDLGAVLSALATPSFLSEQRIVVVREAGALTAAQVSELAAAIAAPGYDNHLVVAGGSRNVPAAVAKAIKTAKGRVLETEPGRQSRARNDWFDAHVSRAPVHLDAAARRLLAEHIGEDAARLDPILDLLSVTYGSGRKITTAELEPLLGEKGAAPPWELTDAIASGDTERAIGALRRLLGPGGRHELQVLATLRSQVSSLLRLDGADDARSADAASSVLGMAAYPAKKLFEQARRLGHARIIRSLQVVANADADMRGRVAWPSELVLEVAVARLAQLNRTTAATRPRR
jgi:DNA polymerase III delta subunit